MKKLSSIVSLLMLGSAAFSAQAQWECNIPDAFNNYQSKLPGSIISNPDGREALYTKRSFGTLHLLGTAYEYSEEAFAEKIVWGEDDSVYFWNPLSLSDFGNYMKGTVKDNVISVKVPQTIYYDEYRGCDVNVVVMKAYEYQDSWGRDAMEYRYDDTISEFSYILGDDGSLTLSLPGEPGIFDVWLGDYAIGYVYADDNSWTEYADCLQEITPLRGELVKMPENVETETYSLIWSSYGINCEVARVGNTLYVQGMNPNIPDGVFTVTLDGDKGYIAQNQIIGIFSNYFIYTKTGEPNPNWDMYDEFSPEYLFLDEDYVVDVKNNGNVLASPEGNKFFILNGAYDRLYELCAYNGFRLQRQDNFSGTLANPYDIYWYDEFETGGVGQFFFDISDISTEGNLLDENSIYYMLYVNGEPMVFEEAENTVTSRPAIIYNGIKEPTKLIPYMFSNWTDINVITDTSRRMIDIYKDVEKIGVQGYYIYDGVTQWTDVVSYNRLTNAYTTEPGEDMTGVLTMAADKDGRIVVYNLQGVKVLDTTDASAVKHLPRGLYIINGRKYAL